MGVVAHIIVHERQLRGATDQMHLPCGHLSQAWMGYLICQVAIFPSPVAPVQEAQDRRGLGTLLCEQGPTRWVSPLTGSRSLLSSLALCRFHRVTERYCAPPRR